MYIFIIYVFIFRVNRGFSIDKGLREGVEEGVIGVLGVEGDVEIKEGRRKKERRTKRGGARN